jgi:hypothetical protein
VEVASEVDIMTAGVIKIEISELVIHKTMSKIQSTVPMNSTALDQKAIKVKNSMKSLKSNSPQTAEGRSVATTVAKVVEAVKQMLLFEKVKSLCLTTNQSHVGAEEAEAAKTVAGLRQRLHTLKLNHTVIMDKEAEVGVSLLMSPG